MTSFAFGKHRIGHREPSYFIADISANHDGDLERAKQLIRQCAEAGANGAKFQNFRARHIVSDYGFKHMGGQQSHQAQWKKTVFEVYQDATLPWEWTEELKAECDKAGVDYFSSPYDMAAIDMLDSYVPGYKIGSGDVTWLEIMEKMASKGKPLLLATGASDIGDVQRAMRFLLRHTSEIVLMQCNTNYTASLENFKHIHLNVLKTFAAMYPDIVLGLSDHTPGHATVLGAVSLGARVIEKHFTDDNNRVGPDHPFSMTPVAWREMVDRTRELELALGSGDKFVAENEQETVVIQRRALRAAQDIPNGTSITKEMVEALRPAPRDGIFPYQIDQVIGKTVTRDVAEGEHLKWTFLSE